MTAKSSPIEKLYDMRRDFTVVGLTGVAGSGCTTLAQLMSSRDFLDSEDENTAIVRKPEDIVIPVEPTYDNDKAYRNNSQRVNERTTGATVFKRKYNICYTFAKQQYRPFTIIKYTHIIWLFALIELYREQKASLTVETFLVWLRDVLLDKFQPSTSYDDGFKKLVGYSETKRQAEIENVINGINCEALVKSLKTLPVECLSDYEGWKECEIELREFIQAGSPFNNFIIDLLSQLGNVCIYSLSFLHHRMAGQIRKVGSLKEKYNDVYKTKQSDFSHLYLLAQLLNVIIKGYQKEKNEEGKKVRNPRNIVVDSIRNSLEAHYLKERYSAFYLVAVHDEFTMMTHLQEKIKQGMPDLDSELVNLYADRLFHLSLEESKQKDFEKGEFFAPNTAQVVADAEIHISNVGGKKKATGDSYAFHTLAEQWMKYSSLILHPGLITPSAEERCMVVAYTAKFNSSCLSRQVGAVITNQFHAIRTIGWNDVPYGQVPCGLRGLDEICHAEGEKNCVYSEFEGENIHKYKDDKSFTEHVNDDFPDIAAKHAELKGLPMPYCFKTLHNRYEGKENQVFTRSLHAEENAILQMAKYGGEALMNGVIYVTASPCELCAKKLYQIGVRKIVYIDPYPGISRQHIIKAGFKQPALKLFQGAYGATYFKLYQPFMSYKDEIDIRINHEHALHSKDELLEKILDKRSLKLQATYKQGEIDEIMKEIFGEE